MAKFKANLFTSIPSRCPVWWGGTRWDSATVQFGGSIALRRETRRGLTLKIVSPEQVELDLSEDSTVRAYAPLLLSAVKGMPKEEVPLWAVTPLWDVENCGWGLAEFVRGDGVVSWYQRADNAVHGSTPEATLLKALATATNTAK